MNMGNVGAGTDSAYSSPTGKDTDSAFQLALGDAPGISPARSLPSDRSAPDLPVAAATPPISDARPRPPSAGQPSCADFTFIFNIGFSTPTFKVAQKPKNSLGHIQTAS